MWAHMCVYMDGTNVHSYIATLYCECCLASRIYTCVTLISSLVRLICNLRYSTHFNLLMHFHSSVCTVVSWLVLSFALTHHWPCLCGKERITSVGQTIYTNVASHRHVKVFILTFTRAGMHTTRTHMCICTLIHT